MLTIKGERKSLMLVIWCSISYNPTERLSLAKGLNDKLAARFYGPFPVIQRIGRVAYKLQLPAESKIHPVFHISQLKKSIAEVPSHPTVPAQLSSDLAMETTPEQLLQVRHHAPDDPKPTKSSFYQSLKLHGRMLLLLTIFFLNSTLRTRWHFCWGYCKESSTYPKDECKKEEGQ